jgi:hypothetical protein
VERAHWYRRVLPVTALAVGLVALLALAVPSVRDQIRLSASHQPQQYVALSFARDSDGTVPVCAETGEEVSVVFTVDSALRDERTVDYVVQVGPERRAGTVEVAPGESVDVTQVLHRPQHHFAVAVRLPDADREVIAHCGSTTR